MPGIGAEKRISEALDAAHRTQPDLNAFTLIDDGPSMERAARLDGGLAGEDAHGPLAGVPVALKDLIDHEGRVTTCGSAFYRKLAVMTAPSVARLERAGAVVIGRTGLHEWAFGFSSENPHFGPVRNPWDPSTSAGGSSGGSAAAVAAGVTSLAIGTDTGGSVRVPAALCGTYGLKVTHGRIPLDGVFPLVPSLDTVGPLADSIENIEIAYRVMSLDRTPATVPRRLKLGIPGPWYDNAPLDPAIAAAFESAIFGLGREGHSVRRMPMEGAIPSRMVVDSIAGEVSEVHRAFRARGETYGEDVARRLDDAERVTTEQRQEALRWRSTLQHQFAEVFRSVDFLVTPTVPIRRKVIGEDLIDGRHYRSFLAYFTSLVNQSLHPALAMPLADSGAPPASLQLVGPIGSEASLIGLGRALERVGIVRFTPPPANSPIAGER